MNIIKEVSKYNGKCAIYTNCYTSTVTYFDNLIELAKNDFPKLNSDNIEIVMYGGERINHIFGIEFYPTSNISSDYREVRELELHY